jgi:hypothetical protein
MLYSPSLFSSREEVCPVLLPLPNLIGYAGHDASALCNCYGNVPENQIESETNRR